VNVTWLPHFTATRNETIIYTLWILCTLNVQVCKSRKNVLLCISKQDEFPFFNCRGTELSLAYRARAWARCTQVWRVSDPFVLEHEQHYSLLYELNWEVRSRLLCVKSMPKLFRYFWPGWCMQLLLRLHFVYRRLDWKGVYLHGPSCVGKSTVL